MEATSSASVDEVLSRILLRPRNIEAPDWHLKDRRRDDSYSEDSPASSSSSSASSFADPSESPSPTPVKKIKNVKKSGKHFCAVCGDRPTGYHYNVLSCNGCKTFFRRTVIAKRKFTCMQGGKCQFTKNFRCACRACRFAKCVAVGMNPKGIQFPSTSKKTEEHDEDEKSNAGDEEAVVAHLPRELSRESDSKDAVILKLLMDVEGSLDRVRRETYPVLMETPLSKMLERPCALGSDPYNDEPCTSVYSNNKIRHWMVTDLMLTIEYAKTIPRFRELTEFDQRVLLSNVAGIVSMMTQAYYSFQKKCDSLVFPDGTHALNYQMTSYGGRFEPHFRESYCRPVTVVRYLKMDRLHFALLKAIVLFTPHDERLSENGRKMIEKERWRLCRILLQIFRFEHGEVRGSELFSRLLLVLDVFIRIAERKRDYLLLLELLMKVRLSKVGKEIFFKDTPQ